MADSKPGTSKQQNIEFKDNKMENTTVINNQIINTDKNITYKIPDLCFELPSLPNYDIVGREADLREITGLFKKGIKRVAICGMGGMGKTTLAIYCAHKWNGKRKLESSIRAQSKGNKFSQFIKNIFKRKLIFKNVFYFSVESKSNFENSVGKLATLLTFKKSAIENQSVEVIFKVILNLYQSENTLVVLDNLVQVEDVLALLDISKQYEHLYILGTSQNVEIDVHFEIHNLSKIPEAESLDLFLNVTGLKIEGDEQSKSDFHSTFHELYELVDGLPISVSHAAAWIKQNMKTRNRTKSMEPTTESYTSLLKKYINNFNDELKKEFPPQFKITTSKSAFLALKLNMDKLLSGESKRLLAFLSYMDPARIRVDIFNGLFDDLESALGEITQYSLIYIEMRYLGRDILIHRLVQEVARTYLASESGSQFGPFILMLLFREDIRHLGFMIKHLNGVNKIPEWLNLSSKEDLKAAVDRWFELDKDNKTLDRLRDAGCDVRDGANWPLPHKLMAIMRWKSYIHAALFFLVFDSIFNKINAECLSGAEDGLSLHHVAVANSNLQIDNIHEYLATKGLDINKRTTRRQLSPMHLVTTEEDISLMVGLGADVNAQDVDGNTPLHAAAARHNNYDVVFALLRQPGVQLDAKNAKNQTTLMVAVENKHFDAAEDLIEAGARYDFRLENGDTILHYAAKHHYYGTYLIEFILDRIKQNGQISVDDINLDGDTPAHLAVCRKYNHYGDLDKIICTLQQFVAADANLNIRNNRGQTLLDLAQAEELDEEVIEFLKICNYYLNE